jgi:hypothetical protein
MDCNNNDDDKMYCSLYLVRRGETKVSYYEEKGKGEGAQQLSIKWIEVRIPRHASVLLGTLGKGR